MDVGEALRTRIENELASGVGKYFNRATDAVVTVARNGGGQNVEVDCTVHLSSGISLQAEGFGADAHSAFGDALDKLEKRVPFLATTASITPFIGLFGTVWGIMMAFSNIGAQGSTDLSVVAPGIADALIATAVGLFAAIPAVIFYNFFVNRTRVFTREIQSFSEDLAHRIEKDYFRA